MITDDVKYDHLIHLLYDSLEVEQGWTKALIALADYIKADHIILDLHPKNTDLMTARLDPEHIQAFVSHPEYSFFRNIVHIIRPGRAVLDEEIFDRKLRFHSDFYGDVIRPMGGHHAMLASLCNASSKNQPVFVACRSAKNSAFSTEELAKLQRILPHVKNALRFHERFAQCNTELQWRDEALEVMPFGLFVLDSYDRVIYLNLAANVIIQHKNVLLLANNGRLATALHENTCYFRKAILDAHSGKEGMPVRVKGISQQPDLWLRVIPVFPDGHIAANWTQARVIVICETTDSRKIEIDKFAAFFKLSRREAELAILLVKGATLNAAAELLGVSIETARSHLKTLFDKTDTHRQVDFVKLLLSFKHLF